MVVCGWPILACAGDSCHDSNGHPGGEPSRTHGTYQRDRLVSRRGSRGFASLTVRVRPASSLPWSPAMAGFAVGFVGILTKAKPLGWAVLASLNNRTSPPGPHRSKTWPKAPTRVGDARI